MAENLELADEIHIPKEDSRKIEQFRRISLLNVEGKIFFGVIAKRMTRFVINNGYVCRERINKWKNLNWIKKKKENLNLQKLPEVPDGEKGWRMRKEKRHPLDKEEQAFFLFPAVTSNLTTSLLTGVWALRHTSLD